MFRLRIEHANTRVATWRMNDRSLGGEDVRPADRYVGGEWIPENPRHNKAKIGDMGTIVNGWIVDI